MIDNATLAYRLSLQPDQRINVVIGVIHIIWFFLGAFTSGLWFNQIRFRMRVFGFWGLSGKLSAIFGLLSLGFLQYMLGLENAILLCSGLFLIALIINMSVDEARGKKMAREHRGE